MALARHLVLGKDHTAYGEVFVATVGHGIAMAITRGRYPKPYGYVDENEDVAAVTVGGQANLLVVADGHNGFASPEVAVGVVVEHFADPPADVSDDELIDLFDHAGRAVLDVTHKLARPHRESRTTLTVALRSEGWLRWAAMGDTALYVVTPQGGKELTAPRHHFVGYPMTRSETARRLQVGGLALGAQEWVVVASDGFANFVPAPTPEDAVAAVLRRTEDPAAVAELLIELAGDGGAGDNVAVVVAGPTSA